MPGIVYLLTNPAMPDLVKIGITNQNIEDRMKQLSRYESVPVPFECHYACEVEDADRVEETLHKTFAKYRKNEKREFFEMNPEQAKPILELICLKDVTPLKDSVVEDQEEQLALEKARKKSIRSPFTFSMVDIPVGSTLSFINREKIVAKVVDNNNIEFEDEIYSLSGAALEILAREGRYYTSASGPMHWMYEGETLHDRRNRMEKE